MTTRESMAVLGGVVAGSTAGFLAGLLMAPRSGRDTRRQIGRRLDDEKTAMIRRGREVASSVGEKLEHGLEEGKRVVAQVTGR